MGKTGRVLKVYVDGDLRVAVGNQTWTFNPACVSQVPAGILTDLNNTMGHNEREDLQSKRIILIYSKRIIPIYRKNFKKLGRLK